MTDFQLPNSFYRCVRDSQGNKCWSCIVLDSCRREQRWYRKKAYMEAHLQKIHDINVVLPRGLRIEEEQGTLGTFFNKRSWDFRVRDEDGYYKSCIFDAILSYIVYCNILYMAIPPYIVY